MLFYINSKEAQNQTKVFSILKIDSNIKLIFNILIVWEPMHLK